MKSINLFYTFLSCILCNTFIYCSKDNSDTSSNNLIIQSISVLDSPEPVRISGINKSQINKSASNTVSSSDNNEVIVTEHGEMAFMDEFDVITNLKAQTNEIDKSAFEKSNLSNDKSAARFTAGNKFRLIIYEADDMDNPIYNGLLSSGVNPNIQILSSREYEWFAFSINDPHTAPNVDNNGIVAQNDLMNKDFMFAKGTIKPVRGNNYLKIVFQRQTSAFELTVNTRGIFGGMLANSEVAIGHGGAGTAFENLIQTGDFNIMTGEFENVTVSNFAASGADFTIADPTWADEVKKYTFYSIETTDRTVIKDNLKVRFNTLSIELDNGDVRTFSPNTVVTIRNSQPIIFGKSRHASAGVLLVEPGIRVGSKIWARTNLIYHGNLPFNIDGGGPLRHGPFRFVPNNEYSKPALEEFFRFNASAPESYVERIRYSFLPCSYVFPGSVWTEPHSNDMQELADLIINNNQIVTESESMPDGGIRHAFHIPTTQAPNPAYPDTKLILAAYGYIDVPNGAQHVGLPNTSITADGKFRYYTGHSVNSSRTFSLAANVTNGQIDKTTLAIAENAREVLAAPYRCIRSVSYPQNL